MNVREKKLPPLTTPQIEAIEMMQQYDGVKVSDGRKKATYERLVQMGVARHNKMHHNLEWVDVYSLDKRGYAMYLLKSEGHNGYKTSGKTN